MYYIVQLSFLVTHVFAGLSIIISAIYLPLAALAGRES